MVRLFSLGAWKYRMRRVKEESRKEGKIIQFLKHEKSHLQYHLSILDTKNLFSISPVILNRLQ
jgi:hypothetical protein